LNPKHPLFVIGHKNPDTYSVCSAIAYARFKNEVLDVAAVPYRAGHLNPQTSFALSRFDVEIPDLLTDVYPKIADIMVPEEQLITLREGDTLHDARDLMVSNRFSFLPVVDAEGRCAGQITALQLAGLTQEIAEACQQERVVVDLERFVRSAGGRLVVAGSNTHLEGRLVIEGIFGDDDRFVRGVIARVSFLTRSRFRVAMVDHNEFAQAVDGIEEAQVAEIIDHHRLGNRNTDTPITFINKVVGSAATIVAELYKIYGQEPSHDIAGILLSAILSDTVFLRSPTTTEPDKELAEWLASLTGLEVESYGEEMFAARSALGEAEPEQIIGQDMKVYAEGGCKFSVSQIEVVGFKRLHELKGELADALEKTRAQEACNFSCLMVTDITEESSLLLCAGEKKVLDAIAYPAVEAGLFEMKGVLSRKKQALPDLLELLWRL